MITATFKVVSATTILILATIKLILSTEDIYTLKVIVATTRGTGMIASSSTFRPHLGRVIRDLFRLLDAVYGIARKN